MQTHSIFKWIVILGGLTAFHSIAAQTVFKPDDPTTPDLLPTRITEGAISQSLPASNQGNTGTSLFTGRMTYSIPIYTIDDPDFHLDIALRYNAEGFKPFQPSGCYGQDWTLSVGGSITRSVHGHADEQKIEERDTYFYDVKSITWGFLRAIQEKNIPNKNLVFNMDPSVYDTCGVMMFPDSDYLWTPCEKFKVDYMPDIFYFNFCGHKGRFIINNQGKAKIISGDFVKIDLSNIYDNPIISESSYDPSSSSSPQSGSQIKIHTMDGYTYVFGGKTGSLEYSVLCKRDYSVKQNPPYTSAWHLTQIIAPNGREMTFTYNDPTDNSLKSFITDYDWTEQNLNDDSTYIVYSLHKECLLESITTSDATPFKVRFVASKEAEKMYSYSDFSYCAPHLQLDSIIVSHGERIIRTAQLSYRYRTHNNFAYNDETYSNFYWRYLKNVSISGIGNYSLDYFYFDPTPSDTIDGIIYNRLFWYPNLYPRTNTKYKATVDRWGYWTVTSLQGMLSQVSLPTGGKIKFTYGNHQYGEERQFRAVGNQDIEFYSRPTDNQSIGGVRIEKIEMFSDDNTLVETKNYSYTKQGTTSTSGIYYNIYEIYYPSYPNKGYPVANPFNYGMVDSHIGYSYVTQTTTIGSQTYKTAYTFDTGRNFYTSVGNNLINKNYNTDNYSDTTELCSGSLTYDGWMGITGKLLALDQYKGNSMLKSTRFKYNGIPLSFEGVDIAPESILGNTDTIVCLSKYSGHIARKLIVCPDVLEQVVTYEYGSDGEPMTAAIAYSYDSKLRKKSSIIQNSTGAKYFKRYTYPDDLPSSYLTPLYMLKAAYRIGEPIETISGFIKDNIEYVTSGMISLYTRGVEYYIPPQQTPMYIPIPDSIGMHLHDSVSTPLNDSVNFGGTRYYPYLYQTKTLSLTSPIPLTYYHPMSNQDGDNLVYDSLYRLTCEYSYSPMYRLTSIKPFGAAETRYTWDGIYPVSKIIGNQTYTYTYIPYVGVSSVTDPRGITTYYSYDASGRLIESYQIVNEKKQIIQIYQYHTKTE